MSFQKFMSSFNVFSSSKDFLPSDRIFSISEVKELVQKYIKGSPNTKEQAYKTLASSFKLPSTEYYKLHNALHLLLSSLREDTEDIPQCITESADDLEIIRHYSYAKEEYDFCFGVRELSTKISSFIEDQNDLLEERKNIFDLTREEIGIRFHIRDSFIMYVRDKQMSREELFALCKDKFHFRILIGEMTIILYDPILETDLLQIHNCLELIDYCLSYCDYDFVSDSYNLYVILVELALYGDFQNNTGYLKLCLSNITKKYEDKQRDPSFIPLCAPSIVEQSRQLLNGAGNNAICYHRQGDLPTLKWVLDGFTFLNDNDKSRILEMISTKKIPNNNDIIVPISPDDDPNGIRRPLINNNQNLKDQGNPVNSPVNNNRPNQPDQSNLLNNNNKTFPNNNNRINQNNRNTPTNKYNNNNNNNRSPNAQIKPLPSPTPRPVNQINKPITPIRTPPVINPPRPKSMPPRNLNLPNKINSPSSRNISSDNQDIQNDHNGLNSNQNNNKNFQTPQRKNLSLRGNSPMNKIVGKFASGISQGETTIELDDRDFRNQNNISNPNNLSTPKNNINNRNDSNSNINNRNNSNSNLNNRNPSMNNNTNKPGAGKYIQIQKAPPAPSRVAAWRQKKNNPNANINNNDNVGSDSNNNNGNGDQDNNDNGPKINNSPESLKQSKILNDYYDKYNIYGGGNNSRKTSPRKREEFQKSVYDQQQQHLIKQDLLHEEFDLDFALESRPEIVLPPIPPQEDYSGRKQLLNIDDSKYRSMDELIKHCRANLLIIPEKKILSYALDICQALSDYHKTGAHGKLSINNVSIVNGHAQLTKVELCHVNPFFLAPELHSSGQPTKSSDSWSLGILLYALSTLNYLYENETEFRAYETNSRDIKIHSKYSPQLLIVIKKLLKMNPKSRTAVSVVSLEIKGLLAKMK